MPEPLDPTRLEDIGARLAAQQANPKAERRRSDAAGMGLGLRMGSELFAALVVGTGIGMFLDGIFATRPWMMVVFLFMGAAAGMLNAYRATQSAEAEQKAQSGAEDRSKVEGRQEL